MSLPGDVNEVDINTLNIAPGEEGIARVVSDLVPVTFPVKDAFPHNQKSLKPLVASLEVWWDSNEIFGMPKGGLPPTTSQALPLPRFLALLEQVLPSLRELT